MKTAIVYDRINKWGGAERILLALHKFFPDAPVYTSVHSLDKTPWSRDLAVKTSFLQNIKFIQDKNQFIPILMPLAFESFNFDNYDLVISVTSEAAKGIITKPSTTHICYCLTPTRYLWSGYEDYLSNSILRALSKPAIAYLRHWDKIAATRPDHIISISSEVKNRVNKYYGIDSKVIFPPVMINNSKVSSLKSQDYFLFVSRMSRFSYYKKTDLVIESFNKTKLPLKIIGSGPMLKKFKSSANENIEFLNDLTDKELTYYYKNCRALVFPGKEDFGLVMAEAQSFGKPVIAYKAGGALDIVEEGITGMFFEKQNSESLNKALISFDEKVYNTAVVKENAQKFSYESFRINFNKFLEEKL